MSFPRYPKYKPCGVSWFGDAPEHWPTIRYKNVFKEKQSVSGDSLPSGSISFGRVVFKSDKILHELTKASYQEVLAGEFLINPINLNYDLKSLRTGLSDINTCVSPAYIVLRAKAESDKNYLKYQLHLFDVSHMKTLGAGVRQTITFGDIGTCSTCLPPLAEQTAIAEFLDRETGKIDELVAEQRRLMELLKEKRQAVISHAVTKGLNPHAPMKPSGIEWLGDVPEHWEVIPIKWLSPVKRGASPRPIDDPKYFDEEGEYAWVRIADVSACDGVLRETTQRLSPLGSSLSVKILPNELFVSIAGTVGKPCISAIKACIHDGFVYFPTLKINPLFLFRIFEAGDCYGGLGKWGTQLNLNTDTVGSIRVAIPPEDELLQLLTFLEDESSRFDTLTAEAQRAIDLLQERRTALISAAVTGQIDVRQQPKN